MDYREINRALKIAKLGVLYPKEPRDARIIVEINKGVKSVMELNLILEREGFETFEDADDFDVDDDIDDLANLPSYEHDFDHLPDVSYEKNEEKKEENKQ